MNQANIRIKVGDEVEGRTKAVTLERMRAFSGWPNKNIHTDEETARSCGLPSPIASATMYMGYVTELLLNSFGEAWIEGGRLELAFVKIVAAGDELRARGKVVGEDEGGVKLEVWCETQRGEPVAAGTAWGPA